MTSDLSGMEENQDLSNEKLERIKQNAARTVERSEIGRRSLPSSLIKKEASEGESRWGSSSTLAHRSHRYDLTKPGKSLYNVTTTSRRKKSTDWGTSSSSSSSPRYPITKCVHATERYAPQRCTRRSGVDWRGRGLGSGRDCDAISPVIGLLYADAK